MVDLHGNSVRKETAPDGTPDKNVFEIKQGVSISHLVKGGKHKNKYQRGDLYGQSFEKLKLLSANTIHSLPTESFNALKPFYFFDSDVNANSEYHSFISLNSIMPVHSTGVKTHRDHFVIDKDESQLVERFKEFFDDYQNDEKLRLKYNLKDNPDWQLNKCRDENSFEPEKIKDISYRPFDIQKIYYSASVIDRTKFEVMKHMKNGNIGLVSVRQVAEGVFNHCIVSSNIIESRMTLSNKGTCFIYPLNLMNDSSIYLEIEPNLGKDFLKNLSDKISCSFVSPVNKPSKQQSLGLTPPELTQTTLLSPNFVERGDLINNFGCRDIFDYIYAVLHSQTYRTRYADFLKSDFPRIPLPKGKDIFRELVTLGKELVELHLLNEEHPKLSQPSIVFRGQGDNRLFKKAQIKWDNGKMPINATQWFEDVPEESVEFSIGGYQPLKKWLYDRAEKGGANPAPGRMLSDNDILHYRRMVVTITETRRLMDKIDSVINDHGGWPDAFVTELQ